MCKLSSVCHNYTSTYETQTISLQFIQFFASISFFLYLDVSFVFLIVVSLCSCKKTYSACSKHIFVYTDTGLKEKLSQVTPVYSNTRMSSEGQPSAHYTAEIESIASSRTII